MRILLIVGALIIGTIVGFVVFVVMLRALFPPVALIVVPGCVPVALGALAFLCTKRDDGLRPSLQETRTWYALLRIAAAGSVLFALVIASFLTMFVLSYSP